MATGPAKNSAILRIRERMVCAPDISNEPTTPHQNSINKSTISPITPYTKRCFAFFFFSSFPQDTMSSKAA